MSLSSLKVHQTATHRSANPAPQNMAKPKKLISQSNHNQHSETQKPTDAEHSDTIEHGKTHITPLSMVKPTQQCH